MQYLEHLQKTKKYNKKINIQDFFETIQKKYGKEAKFEFETGVAYVMPQYIVTNTYEYNNNVRGTKCFANTDAENSKKGNK